MGNGRGDRVLDEKHGFTAYGGAGPVAVNTLKDFLCNDKFAEPTPQETQLMAKMKDMYDLFIQKQHEDNDISRRQLTHQNNESQAEVQSEAAEFKQGGVGQASQESLRTLRSHIDI